MAALCHKNLILCHGCVKFPSSSKINRSREENMFNPKGRKYLVEQKVIYDTIPVSQILSFTFDFQPKTGSLFSTSLTPQVVIVFFYDQFCLAPLPKWQISTEKIDPTISSHSRLTCY